jgi:hypothetical protein
MRDEVKKYWADERGDLSPEEVMTMPENQLKTFIKRKWEFQNLRMQDPDAGTLNTLNGGAEYVKAIAQVRDNVNALKAMGVNPNSLAKLIYAGSGGLASLGLPSGEPHVIQAYGDLERSIKRADDISNHYANLLLQQSKGGGAKFELPFWLARGLVGADLKAEIPESSRLESMFAGRSTGSKLMDVDSIYNDAKQKYDNLVQDSHGQWLRISGRHDFNVDTLRNNKQLDDPLNIYKGGRVPVAYEDFDSFRKEFPHTRINLRMPDGTIVPGRTD